MEPMKRRAIQVRIFRGETKWVADGMDFPIVTEGDTLDEVVANVREAVASFLEGEDLSELGLCENPAIIVNLELEPAEVAPLTR